MTGKGTSIRPATVVGLGTLAIGGLLVLRPATGRLLALDEARAAQAVGALDLALVPGLLFANRRGRWLASRVALNLGIAGYVVATQRHTGRFSRAVAAGSALCAASALDAWAMTRLDE